MKRIIHILFSLFLMSAAAFAQSSGVVVSPYATVTGHPTVTIAGAQVDTSTIQSTFAREAQVQFVFGTVTGSYTTCTAQAKTTYDGTTWLTLGTAATLTITSNTVNAWTLIEQLGTTSVTTSAVSATAALGFGQLLKFTINCSGSFGTAAPVTVSVILR